MEDFIARKIVRGTTIVSNAWTLRAALPGRGYTFASPSRATTRWAGTEGESGSGVDAVIWHLKAWLERTHNGVSAELLDDYLREYEFRFNRHLYPSGGFATLLRIVVSTGPTTEQAMKSSSESSASGARTSSTEDGRSARPPDP